MLRGRPLPRRIGCNSSGGGDDVQMSTIGYWVVCLWRKDWHGKSLDLRDSRGTYWVTTTQVVRTAGQVVLVGRLYNLGSQCRNRGYQHQKNCNVQVKG